MIPQSIFHLWSHVVLMALLPAANFAASIFPVADCPVTDNQCQCEFNSPFYKLQCSSLRNIDNFEAVVRNASGNIVIMELESVHWNFLPVDSLRNSSIRTLIIGNSSFNTFLNRTESLQPVEQVHHLSLENVTFHERPEWDLFTNYNKLKVLFIYNSSVQSIVPSNFSNYMSKNIESITIAQNDITHMAEDSLKYMYNLLLLRISHNRLKSLTRNVLPRPSNLQQLRLDYNKIHSLPAGVFEDMPHLKVVSLSNNTLSTLQEDVFRPLWRPEVHLDLRDNPLKCDCRISWIISSQFKPKDIIGQCAFPKRLFGRNVKDLVAEDLANC